MNYIKRIIYNCIIRPWLTIIIGVKYENRESLATIKQSLIVGNHNSHFDSLSLMAALPGNKLKKTKAVAAADYFGKSSLSYRAMKFFFNAILIQRKRSKNTPSAIGILDSEIKKGNSLILFPEGSRGKPGDISGFKKGIAILLLNNPTIPFIPVYLDGFGKVLPKDKKLILPLITKIKIGEPLFPKSKDIKGVLEEVRKSILALKDINSPNRNQFKVI